MPELGDFFHLIKTNRLTFGLLLNPWLVFGVSSGVPALYHMIKLKALGVQLVQCVESTFIYRVKLETEEEAAEMSVRSLVLYQNLTYC